MKAFINHFSFEFRTGIRNRVSLDGTGKHRCGNQISIHLYITIQRIVPTLQEEAYRAELSAGFPFDHRFAVNHRSTKGGDRHKSGLNRHARVPAQVHLPG